MHRVSSVAAMLLSFLAVAVSAEERSDRPNADQPSTPIVPPESGTSSSDLGRSGGVIIPTAGVDPGMKRTPPESGSRMPVIPPPGAPSGDPSIKPK